MTKGKITCEKVDCIARSLYTDCYIIGSSYCKFYEKLRKTRYTNIRDNQVQEDLGIVERLR